MKELNFLAGVFAGLAFLAITGLIDEHDRQVELAEYKQVAMCGLPKGAKVLHVARVDGGIACTTTDRFGSRVERVIPTEKM